MPSSTQCTVSGDPCVFPFRYKGQLQRKCVRDWFNPGKTWCATSVDDQGNYVKGDDTTWGFCGENTC